MSWSAEDVKSLKEKLGRHHQLERHFYPHLASWIESNHPSSKAYIGYQTSDPQVDVVEAAANGEIIGYEVKVPHIGRRKGDRALQTTFIVQGIGQALEYLVRGFDRAYLVTLQLPFSLGSLSTLMEKTVPFLGLITISRDLSFRRVRMAEKTHFYTRGERGGVEWQYSIKGRFKGPMPPDLKSWVIQQERRARRGGAEGPAMTDRMGGEIS